MTVVFTFESKVSSAFHKKTSDTKHGARNHLDSPQMEEETAGSDRNSYGWGLEATRDSREVQMRLNPL